MRRARILFLRHGAGFELGFCEAPDGVTGDELRRYREKERALLVGMGIEDEL